MNGRKSCFPFGGVIVFFFFKKKKGDRLASVNLPSKPSLILMAEVLVSLAMGVDIRCKTTP
jgi:hypothetical protein